MRKFQDLFKEKQTSALQLKEHQVLYDFKKVYSALLEKYNIVDFYKLNEKYQEVFLGELNNYWDEEEGLSEKGNRFLDQRSDYLYENSTPLQKKNYLKKKATVVISESLRQYNMKMKLYDIVDEMYTKINAEHLSDILSPEMITNVIQESFNNVLNDFVEDIRKELKQTKKKV
jgi:hypothetical protein